MKTIALETTELVGSLAALFNGKLLVERRLPPRQRSAQSLAPALRDLLAELDWRTAEVDLVATCIGPGSFTGLRVGVTTAKVLAYAAGAETLGVDTLAVIAAGCPAEIGELSVAIDAQRGQVVAGRFQRDADGWPVLADQSILVDIDDWLGALAPGSVVTGPILRTIAGRVPEGVRVLDARFWHPTAATLGRLAEHDYAAGRRDDLWKLTPRYSRCSAAEEKWNQRRQAKQPPEGA